MPQSPRALDQSGGFIKAVSDSGLKPVVVFHNVMPAELYELALAHEQGSHIVSSGALATLSGAKTGRSPRDKRVVRDAESEGDIWWAKDGGEGSPNYEMDEHSFILNRERAVDYLNMLDRLYVFDGFAGWDPESRVKIRVVCGRPYHGARPRLRPLALAARRRLDACSAPRPHGALALTRAHALTRPACAPLLPRPTPAQRCSCTTCSSAPPTPSWRPSAPPTSPSTTRAPSPPTATPPT
jgi:hypothetical protein